MTAQYKIPESVLVVIHTAEMEVLLIERADRPGFWQSVTGSKDEENELLLETAVREVAEETGIVVQNLSDPAMTSATSAICLLYTSPSPRDRQKSRMPSSA